MTRKTQLESNDILQEPDQAIILSCPKQTTQHEDRVIQTKQSYVHSFIPIQWNQGILEHVQPHQVFSSIQNLQ